MSKPNLSIENDKLCIRLADEVQKVELSKLSSYLSTEDHRIQEYTNALHFLNATLADFSKLKYQASWHSFADSTVKKDIINTLKEDIQNIAADIEKIEEGAKIVIKNGNLFIKDALDALSDGGTLMHVFSDEFQKNMQKLFEQLEKAENTPLGKLFIGIYNFFAHYFSPKHVIEDLAAFTKRANTLGSSVTFFNPNQRDSDGTAEKKPMSLSASG